MQEGRLITIVINARAAERSYNTNHSCPTTIHAHTRNCIPPLLVDLALSLMTGENPQYTAVAHGPAKLLGPGNTDSGLSPAQAAASRYLAASGELDLLCTILNIINWAIQNIIFHQPQKGSQ